MLGEVYARRGALGTDHPSTLRAGWTYARALLHVERKVEALAVLEAVVAGEVSRFGPDHEDVQYTRLLLGQVLLGQDRAREAFEHVDRVVAWQREHLEAPHPKALDTLALIHQAMNQDDRYGELLLEAVELAIDSDPKLANQRIDPLMDWLLSKGRSAHALALMEWRVAWMQDQQGEIHPTVIQQVLWMASLLRMTGDPAKARRFVDSADERVRMLEQRMPDASELCAQLMVIVTRERAALAGMNEE